MIFDDLWWYLMIFDDIWWYFTLFYCIENKIDIDWYHENRQHHGFLWVLRWTHGILLPYNNPIGNLKRQEIASHVHKFLLQLATITIYSIWLISIQFIVDGMLSKQYRLAPRAVDCMLLILPCGGWWQSDGPELGNWTDSCFFLCFFFLNNGYIALCRSIFCWSFPVLNCESSGRSWIDGVWMSSTQNTLLSHRWCSFVMDLGDGHMPSNFNICMPSNYRCHQNTSNTHQTTTQYAINYIFFSCFLKKDVSTQRQCSSSLRRIHPKSRPNFFALPQRSKFGAMEQPKKNRLK